MNANFHYKIYPELNVFVVKSVAKVTFEEMIIHVGDLMNDPFYKMGMNGYYDFSLLEQVEGNIDIFHQTAQAMNDQNVIYQSSKTAFILANVNESMRRIFHGYIIMTSQSLVDYRIFMSSDIAMALNFLDLAEVPLIGEN